MRSSSTKSIPLPCKTTSRDQVKLWFGLQTEGERFNLWRVNRPAGGVRFILNKQSCEILMCVVSAVEVKVDENRL